MIIATGILFLLGQFARLGLWNQNVALYAYEPLLFLGTLSLLLNRQYRLQVRTLTKLFIGVMMLSLAISSFWFSFSQNLVAILYLLRLTLYVIAIDIVPLYISRKLSVIRTVYIHIISIALVAPAVLQYALFPDLRGLFYQGWDPHEFRIFGQFFEPAIAAAIYMMMGGSLVALWKLKQYKKIVVGYIVALLVLATLTFSRAFYLASFVTLICICLGKKNHRGVIIASLLLIIFVASLAPKPFGEGVDLLRRSTISSRLTDYQEGIRVSLMNPALGIGYNHIRAVKRGSEEIEVNDSHAGASFHSSFLMILATGGIIGLSVYIAYLIGLSQQSSMMASSMLFLSVFALFDNVLLHPFVLMMLVYVRSIDLISRRRR